MKQYRLYVSIISAILAASSSSCDGPRSVTNDSWAHYQNGGIFGTNSPSLSPDGQFITYASPCSGHGDIYKLKSQTTKPVQLTRGDDFDSSPSFMPDGSRIVFAREHAGTRHIWAMDADGSHPEQITSGDCVDNPIAISRDGHHLLFGRQSAPSFGNKATMRSYLKCIHRPTDDIIAAGDIAVLSPEGRFVVYSEKGQMWTLDLTHPGNERRRIYGEGWPADATADAKLIIALRRDISKTWTGDDEIWALDTDARTDRPIAFGHSPILFGAERNDILYFSGDKHIPYVTNTKGDDPKQINCAPTYKTFPVATWDGSGAVVGSFSTVRSEEYGALFIDFRDLRARNIASLGCTSAVFYSPIVGVR